MNQNSLLHLFATMLNNNYYNNIYIKCYCIIIHMLLNINHSCFYYFDKHYFFINDYYQNIVEIIKKILEDYEDLKININFSNELVDFNNTNKNIRINFNYEHTLVKTGGRDTKNAIIGNIKDEDNRSYLVRIENFDELNKADIIIDYSIPNIYNIRESRLFNDFSKKMIYVSSSLYDTLCNNKSNRNIQCLTTFIDTNQPRRKELLKEIERKEIMHTNINHCFDKDELRKIYENTKILINIHQTEHHQTFEELRVLPALQSGVVVICENSPLSELVPYHEYIIWSHYDNILDKAKEVLFNYDYYYDLIFAKNTTYKLHEMNNNNYNTLYKSILENS